MGSVEVELQQVVHAGSVHAYQGVQQRSVCGRKGGPGVGLELHQAVGADVCVKGGHSHSASPCAGGQRGADSASVSATVQDGSGKLTRLATHRQCH